MMRRMDFVRTQKTLPAAFSCGWGLLLLGLLPGGRHSG